MGTDEGLLAEERSYTKQALAEKGPTLPQWALVGGSRLRGHPGLGGPWLRGSFRAREPRPGRAPALTGPRPLHAPV